MEGHAMLQRVLVIATIVVLLFYASCLWSICASSSSWIR